MQMNRGGHVQLFFESAIANPQFEGSTSAIAIPQLLKKFCSATAIPQSQFFLKSATSSPQLENFNSAIFGVFLAVESSLFMGKKSEVKNLVLLSLKGKFSFSRETEDSKNIFGRFLKPSWSEVKGLECSGLAGDCRKLWNCGSQILKVRNHSSATFF
jgi:hypothetical protein